MIGDIPNMGRFQIYPLQLTKRIYIWAIFLILVPMIILATVTTIKFLEAGNVDRERTLHSVVDRLDGRLNCTFDKILSKQGAQNKKLDEKVKVLNQALQPIVDDLARSFPDVSMGYYAKDIDCILAIAPDFKPTKLVPVPHNQPYFNIYKTGQPEFGELDTSIGWNGKPIKYFVKPIYRNGEIIGHVWANVKTDTIYAEAFKNTILILVMCLLFTLTLIILSYLFTKKVKDELENFSYALLHNKEFPTEVLPELNPILDKIKEHTSKMEHERNRLYSFLEGFPEHVYIQTPDRTIIFANGNFRKAFGEAVGKPCYEVIKGKKEHCKSCPTSPTKKDKPNNWESKCINGRTYDVHEQPFSDHDGSPLAIKIGIDITDRKLAEQELARLDRLNLIGQMAAGIGHEVRNPMTTVRGFLQILGQKDKYCEDKEYFDLMIEEIDRANCIITEFLSVAKNKTESLEVNNLNAIVNSLYPLIQADAFNSNKDVLFERGDIYDLPLNEKEIRQLILNLVHNGFEAMQPGGLLTIKTFLDDEEVVLAVQDQGKGIESDILGKLGTPFFTTKAEGTGLGLAVCYGIVVRHNAAIDIKTGPEGTTFLVRFKELKS